MPSVGDSTGPLNVEEIYAVLSKPVSKRIIELLGGHGVMSFSELSKELKTSTGRLYYYLDRLGSYVTQDELRRYTLTARGHALHKAIKEADDVIRHAVALRSRYVEALDKYLLSVLVPRRLMEIFYKNPNFSLIVATVCTATGAVAALLFKATLRLLEVTSPPLPILHSPTLYSYILSGYLLSYALTLSVTWLVSRLLTGSRGQPLGLAAGVALSQTPLYLVMLLRCVVNDPVALALVLRVMQGLALGLTTAAISVLFRTSRERGFLAASFLLYLNFIARDFLP